MTTDEVIKSLNTYLNSFEYGILIDGTIYPDLDTAPWWKYKTLTATQMDEHHVGICWDFVNYQHLVLKVKHIPHKNYIFIKQLSEDPNDIVTHTFTIVDNRGDKVWIESSWLPYQGIHDVTGYQDVIDILNQEYGPEIEEYEVHEYDADNLTGLTNKEFFEEVIK